MRVCYALNEVIGGAGIGTPAYYACGALAKQGWLHQALALGYRKIGQQEFGSRVERVVPGGKLISHLSFGMRELFHRFPAYTVRDSIFDALATRKLRPCDIFHGWNQHSLGLLRKAKQGKAVTIVERGSTHVDFQQRIIREEYAKFGVQFPAMEFRMREKCRKEFIEADYILVNSAFSLGTFLAAGIPKEKMHCIVRGVDSARFALPRNTPQRFTVLYAGLVSLRKGVPYLLQAWRQLKLQNAQLVFAGTIHPDAKSLIEEYRNDPSIIFRGFVDDMAQEYAQASILVLPTIEEGSAKVTFEAMASGLPVITTPNAGSVIRNGKEGFLIPIRDIAALRERIRYFFDHPTEIQRFGKRGRALAEQHSWQRYQKELMTFYERVAEHLIQEISTKGMRRSAPQLQKSIFRSDTPSA